MNKHQQEAYDTLEYWENHHRKLGNKTQADDYLRRMNELKSPKMKSHKKIRTTGPSSSEMERRERRKQRRLKRKAEKGKSITSVLTQPQRFIINYALEVIEILSAEFPQFQKTKILLGTASRDKAFHKRNFIRFGSKSIEYRWGRGHAEYAQVMPCIRGLHNAEQTALQLSALHEIAHLLVHFTGFSDNHGPRFRQIFSDLILRFYDDTMQMEGNYVL